MRNLRPSRLSAAVTLTVLAVACGSNFGGGDAYGTGGGSSVGSFDPTGPEAASGAGTGGEGGAANGMSASVTASASTSGMASSNSSGASSTGSASSGSASSGSGSPFALDGCLKCAENKAKEDGGADCENVAKCNSDPACISGSLCFLSECVKPGVDAVTCGATCFMANYNTVGVAAVALECLRTFCCDACSIPAGYCKSP